MTARIVQTLFQTLSLVLVAGALLVASCDAPREGEPGWMPDPAGGGDTSLNVGSVSMSLTIGGGYRFGEVSYDISGGNGFHKASSIDAAGSSTLSTIVGGIPFGAGYVVRLVAQDVDQKLTPCTGSATFDITSAATVQVPVNLTCHEVPRPSVPVPGWVPLGLAAFLLAFGALAARRRDRTQ